MSIPKLPSYDISNASSGYSNRVHWSLEPTRCVLLIHDMQQYFIDFYDDQSPIVKQLVANIQRLKKYCKQQGIPVVYTAQPPQQRPQDRALLTDFWGEGLTGVDNQQRIVDELKPDEDDVCLTKWRYSAFQRSALHKIMHDQQRDQLLVCGVYAHIGILATCMEAFMTDIQAFLVADAVADFSQDDHQMAVDYIAKRCGRVVTLEEVELSIKSADTLAEEDTRLSLPHIKADIAAILQMHVQDINDDDSLFDLGLDSIRLMDLVEQWRKQGAQVQLLDFVDSPSVSECWTRIARSLGDAPQPLTEGEPAHV